VRVIGRTGEKGFGLSDDAMFFDVLTYKENGETGTTTITGASDY